MAMALDGEREREWNATREKEEMSVPASASVPSLSDSESSHDHCKQVFLMCDTSGQGFITRDDIAHFCDRRNSALDSIMAVLDTNQDGKITFDEFSSGFKLFSQNVMMSEQILSGPSSPTCTSPQPPTLTHHTTTTHSTSTPYHQPSEIFLPEEAVYQTEEEEEEWRGIAERIDPEGLLKGTSVDQMWCRLMKEDPGLVENFEVFLADVVEELQQSHSDREAMESHVRRVRDQHSRDVSEMEELLEKELKQFKQGENHKKQTQAHKLSTQFEGLLAEREAVIDRLAEQESRLKRELASKAHSERELRDDRHTLMVINAKLQDQLDNSVKKLSVSQRAISKLVSLENERDRRRQLHSMTHTPPPDSPPLSRSAPAGVFLGGDSLECVDRGQTLDSRGLLPAQRAFSSEATLTVGGRGRWRREAVRVEEVEEEDGDEEIELPEDVRQDLCDDPIGTLERKTPTVIIPPPSTPPPSTPLHASPSHHPQSHSSSPYHSNSAISNLTANILSCSNQHGTRVVIGNEAAPDQLDGSLTISSWLPHRDDRPHTSSPHSISRVFKIVLVGNSGVGKTSLITTLCEGGFRLVHPTIGLDFSTKTLRIGEERVVFQLWDTAGQERFHNTLTPVYYRRADAFIIVYDVTDQRSFKGARSWVSIITAALRERPPVLMLVGNKSDRSEDRTVSMEEGRRLALELQALFSETSARSGDNVMQAHTTLARLLLVRENEEIERVKRTAIKLNGLEVTGKNKCRC